MRNVWYHLRRPTLVRRIIIAQIVLLTLLWSLFLTFILWDDLRSPPILTGNKTYETLFTLVERMDGRPQDRSAVLEAFSKALREGYGGGDDPALSINLIVRENNAVIFSSQGAPAGVKNTRPGEMEHVQSEGRVWTSRTLKSPHSDVEVTLFTPASGWNFFIYLNSRGYYILPLLVCFPFLLFPAWLSIRIAMRPWNKVVNEISLRTPYDLSPLKADPQVAVAGYSRGRDQRLPCQGARKRGKGAGFHCGCGARTAYAPRGDAHQRGSAAVLGH